MSITLSSMRIAVDTVLRSLIWSMPFTPFASTARWCSRLTETRLHTAISFSLVFSVISVPPLL